MSHYAETRVTWRVACVVLFCIAGVVFDVSHPLTAICCFIQNGSSTCERRGKAGMKFG